MDTTLKIPFNISTIAQLLQDTLISENFNISINIQQSSICYKKIQKPRQSTPYTRKPKINTDTITENLKMVLKNDLTYFVPPPPTSEDFKERIKYYYNLIPFQFPETYIYFQIGLILNEYHSTLEPTLSENSMNRSLRNKLEEATGKTNVRRRFEATSRLYNTFYDCENILLDTTFTSISFNKLGQISTSEYNKVHHEIRRVINSHFTQYVLESSQELSLEEEIMLPDEILNIQL